MKKGRLLKPIMGIIVSIAVLAIILLTFNLTLGWPNSLITLVMALAVAWFFGSGIGSKISKSSWAAIATTAVVVGLAVGSTAWGVPWKVGTPPSPTDEGNFLYQATFIYIGSEENLPIDNVVIRFPCPNVDNDASLLQHAGNITLFWWDNNTVHPEIIMNDKGQILKVVEYHGVREENLKVIIVGTERGPYGPKLIFNIDRLYPGEGILIYDSITVPHELANKVTLKEIGENNFTRASYQELPPKVEPIRLSFWTELRRKVDSTYVLIETFSRTYENGDSGWYRLFQF